MRAKSQIATRGSTGFRRYLLADAVRDPAHDAEAMSRAKHKQYFREWREHRGLDQDRAADRIGVSRNYLSQLETGARRYNSDVLAAMAKAYNCQEWELIGQNPLIEPDPITHIFDRIAPAQRPQALRTLESFADSKKTA